MEENEEDLPLQVVSFNVCVTVCKIFKEEETDCEKEISKYCLDFILLKGDRVAFIDHYKKLVEKNEQSPLWPYNNATI